jgi:hypothetical protein
MRADPKPALVQSEHSSFAIEPLGATKPSSIDWYLRPLFDDFFDLRAPSYYNTAPTMHFSVVSVLLVTLFVPLFGELRP